MRKLKRSVIHVIARDCATLRPVRHRALCSVGWTLDSRARGQHLLGRHGPQAMVENLKCRSKVLTKLPNRVQEEAHSPSRPAGSASAAAASDPGAAPPSCRGILLHALLEAEADTSATSAQCQIQRSSLIHDGPRLLVRGENRSNRILLVEMWDKVREN